MCLCAQEEAFAHSKMTAAVGGVQPEDPNPGRTRKRLAKFSRLQTIVKQYGKIPLKDYIAILSSHFNDS